MWGYHHKRNSDDYVVIDRIWVKKKILNDLSLLESRRWALVQKCIQKRKEYQDVFREILAAGGAHSYVTREDGDKQWIFIKKVDEFSITRDSIAEPKTPKLFDLGMSYEKKLKSLSRARFRLAKFTAVLTTTLRDRNAYENVDNINLNDSIVNFIINERSYTFESKPIYGRNGNPVSIYLKFLKGPDESGPAYQEVVVTRPAGDRKNIIRIGRAYSPKEIRHLVKITPNGVLPILEGNAVKIGGVRMRMFLLKGMNCVGCGLEGTRFYKEKEAITHSSKPWVLQLYGVLSSGKEVLMTRDHIIPVSKGGDNNITNSQPMCSTCNGLKADKVT